MMSKGQPRSPRLELRLQPVLEERLLSLQYVHLGNIDAILGKRGERFHLTQREEQGLAELIQDGTSRFMENRFDSLEHAKREYLAAELVNAFVARLLGVDLTREYGNFRKELSRSPYNIPIEQKPFFYRGQGVASEAREVGIEAENIMEEEFEEHKLCLRPRLVDSLQKEVMQIKSRVDAGNFTERDYYHCFSIMLSDKLFNLNLDKRCEDVWKALERHFGALAIDIPEYFRDKQAA